MASDPITQLADMVDTKARRLQRDIAEIRRLAARLRDATTPDTPTTEDTNATPQNQPEG